jgi:CRP-like cAMP-binding protein
VLVAEGQPPDEAFVILEGEARVTLQGEELAVLGPGELFGEMAVLADQPRSATVTALTPMELLVIDGGGLFEMLGRETIAWKALESMARRLRAAQQPP